MRITNPLLEYIRKDIPGNFNEIEILKKHKTRSLVALNSRKILPPYEILIHPSGRCNLTCDWCIGGRILEGRGIRTKTTGSLPSSLADQKNMEKVIRGILKYSKDGFRVENVSFSGITGEPLMAKAAFIRAVDLLSKNKVRTGVYTNGALMDDEIMRALLKMDYINISLDAATPKTYAKLKYGGGAKGEKIFKKVIQNITKLAKMKSESRHSKLCINASFVLYPDNHGEIYGAAKMLKKIGVSALRIKQDISGKVLLSKEQMAEAERSAKRAKKLDNRAFRFIMIHRPNNPRDLKRRFDRCVISDLMAAIGSDGNVYPCNYQACAGSPVYGNAIKKSFGDIWEGRTRMKIRARLPKICPPSCDPFKNRANALFGAIKKSQKKYGIKKTEKFVEELLDIY